MNRIITITVFILITSSSVVFPTGKSENTPNQDMDDAYNVSKDDLKNFTIIVPTYSKDNENNFSIYSIPFTDFEKKTSKELQRKVIDLLMIATGKSSKESVFREKHHDDYNICIALSNDELISASNSILHNNEQDQELSMNIGAIYVPTLHQSKGIASALLDALESTLKAAEAPNDLKEKFLAISANIESPLASILEKAGFTYQGKYFSYNQYHKTIYKKKE